ncbi:MAG: hypothetical protein ACRD27_06670 [Terracidiphilus sp.]
MEPALRPMSLGEILDRTAQLYRTHFVLFAGIFVVYSGVALVLGLLVVGLEALLRAEHVARTLLWLRLTAIGVESLILFMVAGAVVAAICRAVAWAHLGEPATIRGAYASILPRLGRYLWLMAITFFVVYLPIALLYAGYLGTLVHFGRNFRTHAGIAAGRSAVNPHTAILFGVVTGIFFLLMIPGLVYTILMALRYALALPSCVLEDLPAWRSIKRGIGLSKGARGRIFVLGLLILVIKMAVVGISQVFIVVAAVRHRGQLGPGLMAVSQVIEFFTNTFLGPIYATGITLFYYDQRVRKEGYDIEWMMAAAGLTPPPPVLLVPEAAANAGPHGEPAPVDGPINGPVDGPVGASPQAPEPGSAHG